MIVRRFMSWAQRACAEERAEGISALARAYLYADMDDPDFTDAEIALTAFLDDPSPMVRHALAEALASAEDAPRHLVLTLAADTPEVALALLHRSPVLNSADLITLLPGAEMALQKAIASRPELPAPVCAALAETADYAAALVLLRNASAHLADAAARRLLHRFDTGELREALLMRPGLSAELRYDLTQATTQALTRFVAACGWISSTKLERLTTEAEQEAASRIAAGQNEPDLQAFVAHLCEIGALKPNLLLYSLFTSSLDLFQTTLAFLGHSSATRVAAFLREPNGSGFAALYRKANLPPAFLTLFRAVLNARLRIGHDDPTPQQVRQMIVEVTKVCADSGAIPPSLLHFLQRLDAAMARTIAQDMARHMAQQAEEDISSHPHTAPTIHIHGLEHDALSPPVQVHYEAVLTPTPDIDPHNAPLSHAA